MEQNLTAFLGGNRRVRAGKWTLRVLTARQLLQARWEAEELTRRDEERGLVLNACVVAKAAYRGPWRAFSSGAAVLNRLTAEEIGGLAQAYYGLCQRVNPSCCSNGIEPWKALLGQSSYERVKWKILKSFGVLPSEPRAHKMTDGDYLYCAVQTILDAQEQQSKLCSKCRQELEEDRCIRCAGALDQVNESFDTARFEELKHHGIH